MQTITGKLLKTLHTATLTGKIEHVESANKSICQNVIKMLLQYEVLKKNKDLLSLDKNHGKTIISKFEKNLHLAKYHRLLL